MRLIRWISIALFAGAAMPAAAFPACTDQVVGVNERCPAWISSYNHTGRGGHGEDVARDLVVSPDGATVYVTGQSRDDATADDQAVVAFDSATGAQRWVSRYTTDGALFDTGSALAISPDGKRLYAVGRTQTPDGSWDWITIAYDTSNGQRLWDARNANPGSDRTWAVVVSHDGSTVYVTGEVLGGNLGAVAYDAETGATLWEKSYDNGGYEIAFDIRLSPDGSTLYAAGESAASQTRADLIVVAFQASQEGGQSPGTIRWVARTDGGTKEDETFAGFDLSENGDRIAIGGFFAAGTKSITTALDTATGQELWRAVDVAAPADTDVRHSVAIAGNRVIRAARVSSGPPTNHDYRVLAYESSTGALAWSATETSPEPQMRDLAKEVAVSPDGTRVFVTGYTVFPYFQVNTFRIEPGHVMTVAYDTTSGTRVWIARNNQSGVGRDFSTSIGVAPDGRRVYLGTTFKTTGIDVPGGVNQTMAYSYDLGVVAYNA